MNRVVTHCQVCLGHTNYIKFLKIGDGKIIFHFDKTIEYDNEDFEFYKSVDITKANDPDFFIEQVYRRQLQKDGTIDFVKSLVYEDYTITSSVRCPIPEKIKPNQEHYNNCAVYSKLVVKPNTLSVFFSEAGAKALGIVDTNIDYLVKPISVAEGSYYVVVDKPEAIILKQLEEAIQYFYSNLETFIGKSKTSLEE